MLKGKLKNPNFLTFWKDLEVQSMLTLKNPNFLTFMNWKNMRIPSRATFNNPIFQSFLSQKVQLYTNPC